MNPQFIDFEGHFGSQDPALQPTAEDFAAFSAFFQSRRAESERLVAEFRRAATWRRQASAAKQTRHARLAGLRWGRAVTSSSASHEAIRHGR